MKKKLLAVTAALLSLSGTAYCAEFQPIGTLGIGGAGVARQNGAFTAYWNPAGGAFNNRAFSFMAGAALGVRGSDGLTENVDRLSDIKFDQIKNFSGANASPENFANVVKLVGIVDDINKRQGYLAMNGAVPIGFAIKHLSFGVYGNFEGFVQPLADTTNVLPTPTEGSTTAINANEIYDAVKNMPATNTNFFTADQFNTLVTKFAGILDPAGVPGGDTTAAATQIVNVLQVQAALTGQTPDLAYNGALIISNTFSAGGGTNNHTINNNTTSVMTKALLYAEVPIAYGHPFNLGRFGTLGVGLAIKPIIGSVYQNQVLLVNDSSGNSVKSGDLAKQLTKNHTESNNIGIDAGVLWKKDIWSVGIVAKNLNKPKFKSPSYQKYVNNPTTGVIDPVPTKDDDVALDPQVRAGVAIDPWKWLTIAADMDITKNSSVIPTTSVKSQNVGGGLEIHPWAILKLRAGAYKNIADSGNPIIATAGFSLGPLDLDAAASTRTFKVDNKSIPDELRVQLMCGFTF